jgi:hypothetical protein
MSEILTESFCERCGTRYTFESAAPKGARLKGLKVMSRGLRNFVMSDDSSIDEAMAAARNETDREATSQQLDAFHKTFNFCMSCRQYTCGNCWNEPEGRCLSCAPHLGHEVVPSPFPNVPTGDTLSFLRTEPVADQNGHGQPETSPVEPMAWPTSDLMREEEQAAISFETVIAEHEAEEAEPFDPLARLEALEWAEPQPESVAPPEPITAEPQPEPGLVAAVAEPEPEPEPIAAAPEPEPEPEPIAAALEPEPIAAVAEPEPEPIAAEPEPEFDDRAAAAAAQTADMFRRFSAGQNLDDAIAAYERAQAAADALASEEIEEPAAPRLEPTRVQSAPEPHVAPAPEPEPVQQVPQQREPEPEPEPVAAVAPPPPGWIPAPDLDRVAATAQPAQEPETFAPAVEPFPEPVAAEPRDDLVLQPTWQVVAPDNPPEPPSPAQPQWPAQPEWPAPRSAEGIPFLGRPAQPTGGIEALWAESAREVATAASVATAPGIDAARPSGGVQPCVSCGLSLSANARFCRRCGSRQG